MGCEASKPKDPILSGELVSPPYRLGVFPETSTNSPDRFLKMPVPKAMLWKHNALIGCKELPSDSLAMFLTKVIKPVDAKVTTDKENYRLVKDANKFEKLMVKRVWNNKNKLDLKSVHILRMDGTKVAEVGYASGYGGLKYTVTLFDDQHTQRDGGNGNTFMVKPFPVRADGTIGYAFVYKNLQTGVPFARAMRSEELQEMNFEGLGQGHVIYHVKPGVDPYLIFLTCVGIGSIPLESKSKSANVDAELQMMLDADNHLDNDVVVDTLMFS